jgi:DNA-binding IscR family transcriptional regulator
MVIPAIAAQERIPRKFLEHILLDLKQHGLVESRRGKFGGYGLRLPPDRFLSDKCFASSMAQSRRLPV